MNNNKLLGFNGTHNYTTPACEVFELTAEASMLQALSDPFTALMAAPDLGITETNPESAIWE